MMETLTQLHSGTFFLQLLLCLSFPFHINPSTDGDIGRDIHTYTEKESAPCPKNSSIPTTSTQKILGRTRGITSGRPVQQKEH